MKLNVDKSKVSFSNEELVGIVQTTLSKGAVSRMKAMGASMTPFIRNEDILTISSLSDASVGLGSVVAFTCSRKKRLTVHRIVKKRGDDYLIKGDNCGKPDGLAPIKNILGVITTVERGDRRIYFGLGKERFVIAFFSRMRFIPFVFMFWRLIPFKTRRFIKCKTHL